MAKPEVPYKPNWQIIEAIGQKIRLIRQKKKLSIYQLANASGLHFVSVSNIENGHKNLTVSTLYDLAKGLKVRAAELLV
jgi:transcriptional regulator with XRE-family HTH domain